MNNLQEKVLEGFSQNPVSINYDKSTTENISVATIYLVEIEIEKENENGKKVKEKKIVVDNTMTDNPATSERIYGVKKLASYYNEYQTNLKSSCTKIRMLVDNLELNDFISEKANGDFMKGFEILNNTLIDSVIIEKVFVKLDSKIIERHLVYYITTKDFLKK